MYNAQGKKPKAPVLVANKKLTELEATHWTDKVFTGDNPKTTASLAWEAGKRDMAANPNKRKVAENVTQALEEKAIRAAEAKLLKKLPPALDSLVDKKHVMDLRRALRRKYASRTNLHRIFSQWDKENKGGISVQDLFYGLNKIGLTATIEESQALHSLATQLDDDPNLSLQEFSDLLFTADESFNTDKLAKLKPMDKTVEKELFDQIQASKQNRTIDLEALEPEMRQKLQIRNKWRLSLQRQL